jgi:hypothetical protein
MIYRRKSKINSSKEMFSKLKKVIARLDENITSIQNQRKKSWLTLEWKEKTPKSPQKQWKQKKCSGKLRELFRPSNGMEIVLDDETYFTLHGSNSYGNDFHYSHKGLETPEMWNIYFYLNSRSKWWFGWQISNRGISQPFVTPSGNAINAKT